MRQKDGGTNKEGGLEKRKRKKKDKADGECKQRWEEREEKGDNVRKGGRLMSLNSI